MPLRGPIPIKLHRKEDAEILQLGSVTCFLLEDGSRTDNRVAAVVMMIPPGGRGPPMHWARMHDELFFVTKGTIRFTTPEGAIDAPEGSLMVAPPRASHSFENASNTEEAEIYMTATPGYYIDYFRMLSEETGSGKKELSIEESEYLMALFGTFPADSEI